jgi:hypothetical protein
MDFIFMLTRDDATAPNALTLVEAVRPLGLRHIGFKDIGADASTLRRLTAAIREAGASPCMEIVATSREEELRGVALARDLGVDVLMGGVHVEAALALLAGASLSYLPFSGRPRGHPTSLDGAPDEVEAHCRDFVTRGCAGTDLLAYRATEAEPLALVAAARRGLSGGRLVVAGSVNTAERIKALRATGADAFTIGTAVLDGSYAPGAGGLQAQLSVVMRDCGL